ncbi:MAG: hypothetical protein DRJ59_02565 [Thermoprotei archaeon]|nr:MAG: hypothetical protein DRJ59_02565 [Thermoprotei archaeon]
MKLLPDTNILIYETVEDSERSSLIKALMSIVKASTAPLLIILGLGVTGAVMAHALGVTLS